MRPLTIVLIVAALTLAHPAEAQWSTPSGVVAVRGHVSQPAPVDVARPQRITWIDFSSGLLGAIIGVLIATTLCDDDTERACPAGAPVIGGAIGAAIGVAVGRVARQ